MSVWLEGMTTAERARRPAAPGDVPTLTRPGAEANAPSATVVTTTADQVMHNRTDPASRAWSTPTARGRRRSSTARRARMCVRPRQELDSPRSAVSRWALQDIERSFKEEIFHVAAEITFPRLSPWKNKTFSTEDGRPARTRWPLYEVVARSGIPLAQAVRDGVYLSVVLAWSCNLNPGREPTSCIPMLRVYPVGGRSGFETSWAHHYQRATSSGYEERRDQHHAKGLRLLFRSKGARARSTCTRSSSSSSSRSRSSPSPRSSPTRSCSTPSPSAATTASTGRDDARLSDVREKVEAPEKKQEPAGEAAGVPSRDVQLTTATSSAAAAALASFCTSTSGAAAGAAAPARGDRALAALAPSRARPTGGAAQ